MGLATIFLIAVSLAMDAFAVSISNGVSVPGFQRGTAVKQGIYFGAFQFLMPVIGYILCSNVKQYIEALDHWIAFLLLLGIGVSMIREALSEKEEEKKTVLSTKVLLLQALATSIDALAVGISFALLDVDILQAAAVIGLVSFVISFCGGVLGKRLGGFLQSKAEIAGGIILILIGAKIWVEHMFFA